MTPLWEKDASSPPSLVLPLPSLTLARPLTLPHRPLSGAPPAPLSTLCHRSSSASSPPPSRSRGLSSVFCLRDSKASYSRQIEVNKRSMTLSQNGSPLDREEFQHGQSAMASCFYGFSTQQLRFWHPSILQIKAEWNPDWELHAVTVLCENALSFY